MLKFHYVIGSGLHCFVTEKVCVENIVFHRQFLSGISFQCVCEETQEEEDDDEPHLAIHSKILS